MRPRSRAHSTASRSCDATHFSRGQSDQQTARERLREAGERPAGEPQGEQMQVNTAKEK